MRRVIFIFFLFTLGCEKDPNTSGLKSKGKPPIANAGPDFSVTLPDESCELDGKKLMLEPSAFAAFMWSAIKSPDLLEFNINEIAAKANPVFFQAGKYNFQLLLKNSFGEDMDTVSVDVKWAPRCNAERELSSGGSLVALEPAVDSIPYNTSISFGGGKLIFAGGTLNDVDPFWGYDGPTLSSRLVTFDPSTKKYNAYTLGVPRFNVVTAVVDNLIFIAGGYSDSGLSNVVEILDMNSGKIQSRKLAYPRDGITTAVIGHSVFFAGGYGIGDQLSDVVEIYDLDTDSWSVTKLSIGRSYISGVVADDKVFFAGGYAASGGVSDVVDVYDMPSHSWSALKLSEAKADVQGANFDGQVVFAGGGKAGGVSSKTIDFFDPKSGARSQDCLVIGSTSLSLPLGQIPSILGKASRLYVNDGGHLASLDKISHKWFYSVNPGANFPMFLSGNSIYTYEYEYANGSFVRYRIYRIAD